MAEGNIDVEGVPEPSREPDFYSLPHRIYHEYEGFVPPLFDEEISRLNRDEHPFFSHSDARFFLARSEDGAPVGRIAVILNRKHNHFHDDNIGFFGFFDTVDRQEVSDILLQRAVQWAHEQQLTALRGPANYSFNESWGSLVEGHNRRVSMMMPFNPPYQPEHLQRADFQSIRDLLVYEANRELLDLERLNRPVERFTSRHNLSIRPLDMSRFQEEAHTIRNLYIDCWSDHWGFVPPTEREFQKTADEMKQIVEPELVLFLENSQGEEVGFLIALPDINEALNTLRGNLFSWRLLPFLWTWYVTGPKRLRVLLLGVREDFRGGGTLWLIQNLIQRAVRKGYESAELSWVDGGNNKLNSLLKTIGCHEVSRYSLFEKEIK